MLVSSFTLAHLTKRVGTFEDMRDRTVYEFYMLAKQDLFPRQARCRRARINRRDPHGRECFTRFVSSDL